VVLRPRGDGPQPHEHRPNLPLSERTFTLGCDQAERCHKPISIPSCSTVTFSNHLRIFLIRARRGAGVKETQLAEGVGFEPTRTEWAPP
jgi:hypothetical protein